MSGALPSFHRAPREDEKRSAADARVGPDTLSPKRVRSNGDGIIQLFDDTRTALLASLKTNIERLMGERQ